MSGSVSVDCDMTWITLYRAMPTVRCLPCAAYRAMPTVRCLPCDAYRAMPTVWVLPTAYLLGAAYCLPSPGVIIMLN